MDNPIRNGVCRSIVIFAIMGAVSGNIFSLEIDTPADLNMIQDLRQRILDQAQQLRSFKGRYRLQQTSEDGAWEKTVEYRFQDGDVYFGEIASMVSGHPKDGLNTYIRHRGAISVVTEQGASRSVSMGHPTWDIPQMALLDPKVLSCELYDEPAEKWLSGGADSLHFRDGMRVLSHRMEHGGVSYDVYFDDAGHIRRLEFVRRLPYPEDLIRPCQEVSVIVVLGSSLV